MTAHERILKDALAEDRKLSKKAANYGTGPAPHSCGICKYYQHLSCKIVSGVIRPSAHCAFFTPKD